MTNVMNTTPVTAEQAAVAAVRSLEARLERKHAEIASARTELLLQQAVAGDQAAAGEDPEAALAAVSAARRRIGDCEAELSDLEGTRGATLAALGRALANDAARKLERLRSERQEHIGLLQPHLDALSKISGCAAELVADPELARLNDLIDGEAEYLARARNQPECVATAHLQNRYAEAIPPGPSPADSTARISMGKRGAWTLTLNG
jgi:hypothetical protein